MGALSDPYSSDNNNITTLDSIYSREPGRRNFNLFPQDELNSLVDIIELSEGRGLRAKLYNYFLNLAQIGADSDLIALIGHSITSYLHRCVENNQPWATQFLFPPALNPKEIMITLDGDTKLATDHFKEKHKRRNIQWLSQYAEKLIFEPTVLFVNGPMFSAKSGVAAILYGALTKITREENIIPLIFEGMGEDSIHARSLPDSNIPADLISLDSFEERVNDLIETVPQTNDSDNKRVVIVEEATFLATNEDPIVEQQNAIRFCEQVKRLQDHGISVILIGLDMNYRATNLAITDQLRSSCQDPIFLNCTSFHLHTSPSGISISEAERTGRYSTALNMFDWAFPILVPRNLAVKIEYSPLPGEHHPMQLLKDHDPELYNLLLATQRPDLLESHTAFANNTTIFSEA